LSPSPLPNCLADGIRYKITVPFNNAQNFGIIFSYAVVFENPNHPSNIHTYEQQPRFLSRLYEQGGDTISCANFTFVASDSLPGFGISSKVKIDSSSGRFPGGINFALVKYKPWSSVFVNLSKYPGKTFYLEFITTDCTLRGHFGYAYVDVLECSLPISADISCSKPSNVTLIAPPGFKEYTWWNSNYTRKIGIGDTVITNSILENEKVNLILVPYDSYGCKDTMSVIVKSQLAAIPAVRYPTIFTNLNTDTKIQARNIGIGYQWLPQAGLSSSDILNPIFNYDRDVEYLIKINTPNGCQVVDTLNVKVDDGADILVPDAFSPNNDGRNDKLDFFIRGLKKIHFWVFNRWGQLMFETTDPSQKWDGLFSGRPQPLETYVWIAEGTTFRGKIIRKRGQTVLIR
jgi:gliding motility-associated-like protein